MRINGGILMRGHIAKKKKAFSRTPDNYKVSTLRLENCNRELFPVFHLPEGERIVGINGGTGGKVI